MVKLSTPISVHFEVTDSCNNYCAHCYGNSWIKHVNEAKPEIIDVAEKTPGKIYSVLKGIVNELAKIPLKKKMKDTPKVLVVGEIYVRRDDFAVDELVQHFCRNGIIPKISSVSEWIYYCDYTRKHDIKKRLRLVPLYRRLFSGPMKELIMWKLEHLYKTHVDHKILSILNKCELVPSSPHNMHREILPTG